MISTHNDIGDVESLFSPEKQPDWFEAAHQLCFCSNVQEATGQQHENIEKVRRARKADELGAWRSASLHVVAHTSIAFL
jgi:hypothetical protein